MKVHESRSIDIPGLQGGVFPAQCPSRTLLDHVTSKWGVLVLLALGVDTMRWSELRRCIEGISEKMLAQTLKTLEADGLVRRVARPVVPPHVEYNLTEAGQDVQDRLLPLMEWVGANADRLISPER